MPLRDRTPCRSVGLALAGAMLCAAAQSAPQAPADPVAALLQERGLTPTFIANPNPGPLPSGQQAKPQPPSFVDKVRNSASSMVISAMNFLGVRYVRGGNSAEEGFDCSGFTRYIFENSLGLILPRRADEQASAPGLLAVKREDLQPGDLVFFNTLRRTFSHVGIYVGEDKFIHAPRSGSTVRVEDMKVSYWSKRFTGARRAPGVDGAAPPPPAPAATPATTATATSGPAAPVPARPIANEPN